MKSYWSRVGPSFKMTGVFIKKRERNWDTAIHTRRAPEDEGRDRMVIPHTNNCQQTNQREGRGAEQGSQFSEPALPTLIMDSSLQNQCEINFCVRFSQFAVFITAALGNNRGSTRGYGGVMSSSLTHDGSQIIICICQNSKAYTKRTAFTVRK